MTFAVTQDKVRRIEDEDQRAHMLVNVAAQGNQARRVEHDGWNRPFVRPVTSQVETLGWREGKDVVISIIEVREQDAGSGLDRQERRHKVEILLRHFRFGGGSPFRK